ncbi:zinc ribbon domain-containing protein [Ktedonosporobacter rubrisoli]|uniref:Zinc ribbon domain-containing protein n=1 Tax=Ktedonosporobacter rubrisoli TaxID=2509675 RepID=A0A4P6K476_KTERU|nr:zinc ribbon domain-containing protein [Ktedonosporobacter rubrisoli]QBD82733.1 zinc ribbon domain-containing protein [Ktedonosporobacter rubrisoli]
MAFCGQCGYLLAAGAARCPRCGEPTPYNPVGEGTHTNDATILSTPDFPGAAPASEQANSYSTVENSNAVQHPRPRAVPPTYQGPMHTGQSTTEDGFYSPQPVSYPSFIPTPNTDYPVHGQKRPRKSARWLTALIVVFLLIFASAATLFFVLGPQGIANLMRDKLGPIIGHPSPTVPTVQISPTAQPPTPEQQAQSTIELYYKYINAKDYQGAYSLWAHYPQSLNEFAQGYAHTHNDSITINGVSQQSDGTLRVSLTLSATEDAAPGIGTQQSSYQGYYILGRQADGTWKILTANLKRIA